MPPEGTFYNAPQRPDAANVNAPRGYDSNTYLHELAERGAPASYIKEALKLGADINALNRQKMPPLGLALQRGNLETVKALIEAGASLYFETGRMTGIDGPVVLYFNATYTAAAGGDKAKLALVLQNGGGAFVNCPGTESDGYDNKLKPLHAAIRKYKSEVIPLLADAGAFLDEEAGFSKETPLMMAVANDSEDAVVKLVKRGASLEYKHSETGDTPLIYACSSDKRWTADKLLTLGADAHAANNKGRTPLMLAAERGSDTLVKSILAQKPEVNAADREGVTALMLAAGRGSSDLVKLLLQAGADPLLADKFNKSARAYAENSYNNGYNSRGYYGGSSGGHSASWILEEAEKSALQKEFEKTYDRFRKKPPPPAAPKTPGR